MKLSLSRSYQIILLLVTLAILVVNRSVNFDMHHDGLITTNLLQVRQIFENEGPWPFNQYGVTWLIPYLPIILTGNSNSIYERANWISLTIYAITLVLSYITARKLMRTFDAIFVPIILATTVSLGSLRTWPSASAMFFLSGFLLATITYFGRDTSMIKLKRNAFLMGALIPLMILSRVQVGCFLLFVFSILILKFGLIKTRRYFYFGFLSTSISIVYFLAKHNWLKSALMDTFVYSLNYLTKDESRVLPIFTVIGSILVLIVCYTLFSDNFPIKSARLVIFAIVGGLLLLMTFYVQAVLRYGPDSFSFYSILMRRIFVSTLLGTFLYWFISQARVVIKKRYDKNQFQDSKLIALTLVSAASLLQLIPLFDSTHAWWASPPLVILLSLLIGKLLRRHFKFNRLDLATLSLALVLSSVLLLSVKSYYFEKSHLVSFGSNFVSGAVGADAEVSEQNQLSKLVYSKAPKGSKFLNLCINSNIFLTKNDYQSASRFYISWPNMRGYPEFIHATHVSQPDFILTCSDLLNPAAEMLTEEDRIDLRNSQNLIIDQLFAQPKLVGEFISHRQVEWKLWSEE